ncbi:MAG: hypothetical protein GX331_01510, partial [Firmicutes bacterium]|nr:hypothetical protein [Bacillota bacterium]
IYVEQVKAWKDACLQASGGVAQEAPRLQKELKQKERDAGAQSNRESVSKSVAQL